MNNQSENGALNTLRYVLILLLGFIVGWFARDIKPVPSGTVSKSVDTTEIFMQPSVVEPRTEYVEQALTSIKVNDDLELLNEYLKKHDFEAVAGILETLQQGGDAGRLDEANEMVYRFVRELLSAKDNYAAKSLLNYYLAIFNRNVTARLLLVEVLIRLTDYQSAIDQLYLAKGHAFLTDTLSLINRKIRSLVNKHAANLKQNFKLSSLLIFYEKLTQQEADYAPYFIGLAEAQISMGEFEAAKVSLQMIISDADVGRHAAIMLSEVKQKEMPPATGSQNDPALVDAEPASSVKLHKQGNHYLLDVYTREENALRLLIDTGASMTILTPSALLEHNVQYNDTGEIRRFSTANGIVNAPVYQLESLSVGEWEVKNIDIAVLDLQGSAGTEGLLGMNFLQHFQFFIDQKRSLLRMSLRK